MLRSILRASRTAPFGLRNTVKVTLVQKDGTRDIDATVGRNLMSSLEKPINKQVDEEVYGLCGGNLECCTCGVQVLNKADQLPPPKADELKILKDFEDYKEGVTRMGCQIIVNEKLNGLKVELPKATLKEIEKQKK